MSEEGGGIGYWMQWQVFVCAAITVSPGVAAAVVLSRPRKERLRRSDLWSPCWRGLHPAWPLAYRALVVLILSYWLIQMVLIDGIYTYYFYTQWTFTLVIIYFLIGTVISARGCWMYTRKGSLDEEEANEFLKRDLHQEKDYAILTSRGSNAVRLEDPAMKGGNVQQTAGLWGYTLQVIYQTCAGAAVLTDVVFWFILVPYMSSAHFSINLVMGCMHSLNAIFLLLDTALNSLPFPWFRMAYFVLWSCIYVIFQWVLHACGFTWWPYPFLELSTPWAPAWYTAMTLAHVPCYLLYWLIVKAKNSFFTRWFPNSYIRSY